MKKRVVEYDFLRRCSGAFCPAAESGEGRVLSLLLSYAFPIYLFHDPIEYAILRVAFETSLLQRVAGVSLFTVLWLRENTARGDILATRLAADVPPTNSGPIPPKVES